VTGGEVGFWRLYRKADFPAVQHLLVEGHCKILRVRLTSAIRRSIHSATLLALVTAVPPAFAQAPASNSATPTKPLAFDVVSIRPSKPGSSNRISPVTTPDGYRVTGQSILATIMLAYFPQGYAYWSKDNLSGAPSWLSEQYDINAKVSDADLAEWQKQGVALDKKPIFRAMLQTMLADRCHLVAHMVPGPTQSGWALELGKHAPHLTESKPGEELPAHVKLPDGGVMVPYHPGDKPRLTIYAATMADLAEALTGFAGQPVQDHTGLTGRYDFVIDWIPYPDSKLSIDYRDPNDPDPLSRWNLDALGIRVVSIKVPINTLVIDHIERPSEN
jgi:bla regulator protein BlaR1